MIDLTREEILRLIGQCRPVFGPGAVMYDQVPIERTVIERICRQLLAAMDAIEAGINVCKAYEQPGYVGCPNTAGAIRQAMEAAMNPNSGNGDG